MCGIAGIHVKTRSINNPDIPMEDLVDGLLLGIQERGEDATGFVAVSKGGKNVTLDKMPIKAYDFCGKRKNLPGDLRTVLLHTRLATQGSPAQNENNHPVLFGTCFATHNGMINNDSSIFSGLDTPRVAEVDSIVIPTLVSQSGLNAAEKSLEKLVGSFAVSIIDPVNNPDELVLARGESSPLILLETKHFWMWASTQKAIELAYQWYYGTPPAFNKFRSIPENTILKFNADDDVTEEKFEGPTRTVYGGYSGWSNRGSSHTWWGMEDDDLEYAGSLSDFSGKRYKCFQCGEGLATEILEDTKVKPNGNLVTWDYPVCTPCHGELTKWGNGTLDTTEFTYRFASNVNMRETRAPKDVQKSRDIIPVLRAGDYIPTDYRDAFAKCIECETNECVWLGNHGFGICNKCHRASTESTNDSLIITRLKECGGCSDYWDTHELTQIGAKLLCDDCVAKDVKRPDPDLPEVTMGKVTERTYHEVAWQLDVSRDYVVWLLNDCGAEQLKNRKLRKQFNKAKEYFDTCYKVIDRLDSYGCGDLLGELPLTIEAYQKYYELEGAN